MNAVASLPLWGQILLLVPLGAILAVAAFTDARQRKVFNWLTYPAFVAGLILHTIVMGWSGLGAGLIAGVLALFLGILLLPLGWIGGGDIKLLAVVGAFLGLKGLGEVFFYSVLCGSVLGLMMALFTGYLWEMFRRLFIFLRGLVRAAMYRTKNVAEPLEKDDRSHIPFAVAIFAGGILAWLDAFYGWPGWLEIFLDAYRIG
ncbi:MAG: A24 family peptidase [Bradymonadaceae bacterium]